MKAGLRYLLAIFAALTVGLYSFPTYKNDASAKTIVRSSPDDECTRTVFLQIEIYTETDMTDGAMEALADVWANEINDRWNGPTDEAIQQAADELGISDDTLSGYANWNLNGYPNLAKARQALIDKAKANMAAATGDMNCASVNCCKIYFHTIIQVRKPGDDATEGFDQVEVKGADFRSFVRRNSIFDVTQNQQGTSGEWGYTPGRSAAAHEAGHLMGIKDFYHDEEGEDGETHSVEEEGHESDLMANTNGWPAAEHITEILRIAGKPCNCCRFNAVGDEYMTDLAVVDRFAMDALAGNNCEYLGLAKTNLENKLKDLQVQKIPASNKVLTAQGIQARLDQINKALEDCDKPRPMTGTSGTDTAIGIGGEGIPTAPFSYDSLECTTYGGGTIPFPFGFPTYPFGPAFPIFPVGPTQGPAGGGQTPATTPGQTPATTPEGQTPVPGLGEVPEIYIPTGPDLWGGPIIKVTPGIIDEEGFVPTFEYDSNDNVIRPEKSTTEEQTTETRYDDLGRVIEEHTTTTTQGSGTTIKEEVRTQQTHTPWWLVFKVEEDVIQNDGTIGKGPAEKTVLKMGFTPPDAKPGSDVPRTAEDNNNSAGAEPRFVETDENGFGQIFVDGFESGDISSWSESKRTETKYDPVTGLETEFKETVQSGGVATNVEREEDRQTPVIVSGFTLDATPMKSRIVYLDVRFLALEDNFLADVGLDFDINPDDLNNNGMPDWAEIRPELELEAGLEGLRLGGLIPTPAKPGVTTPVAGGGDPEDKPVGPNVPAGGDPKTELPDSVKPYVIDSVQFGNTLGVTLGYKYHLEDEILVDLSDYTHQDNRYLKEKLNDPYYESSGTWGQPYDDQWAIKSVGFVEGDNGAWAAAGNDLTPVIIAFIDSGLDWNHADISWDNVWVNEDEIPDNGIDDDMNGYIDDTIGWDFYTNNPTPWDQDGHGTFTAGMVAATQDNGTGIAGMNPAAKIMVLKALNDFGHTRASYVAKAIKYATDNGARIINLSIGAEHQTYLEYLAVKYAHDRGVVIVAAAGNEAMDISTYGFAPYEEVIAVGSSDFEGKRAFFSNLGTQIDVAAPGLDVLSLRARMTDFMRHLKDVEYEPGSAYVGEDNRYFRSSGTSFSAPIVTGIASLILSKNPDLTNVEVKRMILNSATDTELPGVDQFTGYGIVDATAAINADPVFEIMADIASVSAVQDEAGAFFVDVQGTANANDFAGASIQIGMGEAPTAWKEVGTVDAAVTDGALALIDANEFRTAPVWTIRLVVTHANGRTREQWYVLQLG